MKKTRFIVFSLILSLMQISAVRAQAPIPRVITVQGLAELEVSANRVTFTVNMEVLLKDEASCRGQLAVVTEEQRQFALELGALKEKTRVSSLQISPVYKSWKRHDRGVRHYKGKATLHVEFDSTIKASSWFTSMKSDGTMEVRGPSFYHSDIPTLKKRVLVMAVEAAKRKADLLLSRVGENKGQVLTMHVVGEKDQSSSGTDGRNQSGFSNFYQQTEIQEYIEASDLVIQPKSVELEVRVEITFAIAESEKSQE